MPIYRDKRTGQWRFDFDRYVGGERVRRRQLLPAGWTRAQAEAYDRKESAALYAIASGIAKPRHKRQLVILDAAAEKQGAPYPFPTGSQP